ncbi:hypothetical protein [Bradyrhizobium aeschynomenes]|uniref:hypothetical protein n=1 Tax=Bradyrhizobium aeschynomenes TaxID=2734909 RepID=UPI001554E01E|nr:hypothetical protein [Bradyrhizobium aeschynomenes]NPV21070.1 hypothetical protein [Bradyrhizobium aeschynomenes]
MASNFSTIGLAIDSMKDMEALLKRVPPLAERLPTPAGAYLRWSDPSGAELWIQVDGGNELTGFSPHYAGLSNINVGLTARLPAAAPSSLDGAFQGWADPSGGEADMGCYPFMFDAPDFRCHDGLKLPICLTVQVAAFAHDVRFFETVAAYDASETDDVKFASRSFIPSGLFTPSGESAVPPQARAMFVGHVIAADKKVNSLTRGAFYWALVETYGGTYDVVMDENLLPDVPRVGGVISGSFWLSGRIVAPGDETSG